MNTNRRDFLRMGAIAGATAVLAKSANARTGGTRSCASAALPVPDGPEFAGMSGAYSALVTPYKPDGSVNEEMIEKTIEFGLANGLAGFHLTSSAGEGFLLSADERKTVYDRAAKAARGRAKLIANVGCLAPQDAVALARHAAKVGIDWVSSAAPAYFGQNFDAAYAHYKTISEATDLPLMIYSIGQQIAPDRDVKLFELKNVKGMKYIGYDYWTVKALRFRLPKPAIFFTGADEQELCAFACGDTFSGCIGTTDNMIPAHHAQICRLAAAGRFAEAAKVMDEVVRFVELVASAPHASYWKSIMRYIGLDCGPARSPAGQPLTEAEYAAYAAKLDKLGFVKRNAARA